ncbi:MAG: asparagine synthetase B, partial [Lachnospiraceae bacterium]|nr:asparagine synthetase B [Lachnospiraceae bacterium]
MCGICGFISKKQITLEQLKEMNQTMYHRGPDDHGEEIYVIGQGYQLGFAQRRLSILDLSELGHQPMHSPNGRVSVVYNGELYNFHELKEELSDYPFRSECDTEVIIAGYLKWGIDCIKRFKGMFAIALFDRDSQELYLVRDRIGKKPLYYWHEEGNLVFASELKPIMSCPDFHHTIRRDVLRQYMFQQYINAPDSIFEHVYKLEPGAILRFHNGVATTSKYWDIATVYQQQASKPVA